MPISAYSALVAYCFRLAPDVHSATLLEMGDYSQDDAPDEVFRDAAKGHSGPRSPKELRAAQARRYRARKPWKNREAVRRYRAKLKLLKAASPPPDDTTC